jgi:hypothetical protein
VAVRIEVLTVPDCPNGPVLIERLEAALAGRGVVDVSQAVVADEAERYGSGCTARRHC